MPSILLLLLLFLLPVDVYLPVWWPTNKGSWPDRPPDGWTRASHQRTPAPLVVDSRILFLTSPCGWIHRSKMIQLRSLRAPYILQNV